MASGHVREELAALSHEQWSGWMRYLFSKSSTGRDGTCVIPAELVDRWTRQMGTPYAILPEHEKDSDRAEADKVLEVFRRATALRA